MNNYELTVVLPEKTTPAKAKAFETSLEKSLSLIKGKISKKEDWGKLDLAIKLGKNTSGLFMHFKLELQGKDLSKLNDKLRTDDNILRYLIVRNKD